MHLSAGRGELPRWRGDPLGLAPRTYRHLLFQCTRMRQKWHRQLHERAAAGGAERGSPGTGACPSSSGRGNAWLQPAFGDRQLLLVPRTSLSPGLMRDAYGGMLPWPQRPYKLTGDVTPPPPPPPKSPWSWAAGSGDPRFAPSPAAGCECAHKSSAVLIPLRLWFFFLFPLPYTSLWGSGVTLPVAGALPWLC